MSGYASSDNYSSDNDDNNPNPTFKQLSSRNSIENFTTYKEPASIPFISTKGQERIQRLLLTRDDFPTPEERLIAIWDQLYPKG